jgi:hypothetical protein
MKNSKELLNTLEKFKEMKNSIRRFEKSIDKIRHNREEARKSHYGGGIDKHREGFVKGMSDYGCIPLNIGSYESFSGYWGSSDVHSDLVKDNFVSVCMIKAINELKDSILDKTLEIMRSETKKYKEDAMKGYEMLMEEFNDEEY